MKIHICFKKAFIVSLCFLFFNVTQAQQMDTGKSAVHISYVDSLMGSFRSSVYSRIYNPAFWSKSYKPVYTMLKISIDENGKVKEIKYSDSADALFVKTFLGMPKYYNDIATLEKYAMAKSYKD